MDVFERRVLDALPSTIYTMDLEGRITSVNRSWSVFAASNGAPELASEPDVCGRTIWSAISDPYAREQVERGIELLRSGRSDTTSWEFPCSSPTEERVFLMHLSALRDDGGPISGFVCSTVDITPSHQAREALIEIGTALSQTIDLPRVFQEVSHLVRRALPHDGFAVALIDESSGEARLGHSTGFDEPPFATEDRLRNVWRRSLDRGAVVTERGADALQLTVPVIGTRAALGAMTLVTDSVDSTQRLYEIERMLGGIGAQTAVAIERARLVERVEEKRRLEAVGEVAAGIAQELRNPLFGISSGAQLMRFRSRDDPVLERNVGRILREVERLNGMVTELLEYGHPRPLSIAPANPDEVWDYILEGNRGMLESASLTLDRSCEQAAVCPIDQERMGQVFLNILVNAVEAAPAGSVITLRSRVLPGGAWRCTLHNGGPAIPLEDLTRVFEIFFSTKQGGTGVGLALCRRIVDEHGGQIALDSASGTGTTVTITLPLAT